MELSARSTSFFSVARLIVDILAFLLPQIQCFETIYGREGDTLTLTCPVSMPVNATKTRWTGPPSNMIYSINEEINPNIYRRYRLSVIRNATTGIYNLDIMNLNRLEDEGPYSCLVSTTNTFKHYFVHIAFHDLPNITVFQVNQRQELNESSPFGLTCIVNSSTSTNISIMNQDTGETVSAAEFTDKLSFTETSAKCYQTAEYICTATNIAGNIKSSPVQIFVNCGPRPLNGIYFQKLVLTLGSSLELTVNATGFPLPKSEWTFISTTRKTLSSSLMGTFTSINITTSSYKLKKPKMDEDEFGLYTLHLINDYGILTSSFYVFEEVNATSDKDEKTYTPCTCSVTGKLQDRSESSTAVPILSALVGVLFIICIIQLIYIIIWKVCQRRRKDKSSLATICESRDYVMQNIQMEDHQYQTITSDHKNGQNIEQATEKVNRTKAINAYNNDLEKDDQYQNLS